MTINEYTLKNSFAFVIMASLDMNLLFASVSLSETIKNWIDELFKSGMTVSGLKDTLMAFDDFKNKQQKCMK